MQLKNVVCNKLWSSSIITQGMCDKGVVENDRTFKLGSDNYKSPKMFNQAVDNYAWCIRICSCML